jgi:hypothetical protein
MAKRGRSPDLRSQLGSLLTNAWQQLDSVREVVTQRTKAGRVQLDLVLLKRKRKESLAKLGEAVLAGVRDGRIEPADVPEIEDPLAELEAIDEKIEREERRARAVAAGLPADESIDDDDESGWDEGGAGEFDEDAGQERRRRASPFRAAAEAAAEDDDELDEDLDEGLDEDADEDLDDELSDEDVGEDSGDAEDVVEEDDDDDDDIPPPRRR